MITNTNCEKCLFADRASADEPCKFDIINHISANKHLEVVSDYYRINNYQCQYCLSKDFYLKNKEQFFNIDIMEYIKQKVLLKYYLLIDCNKYIDIPCLLDKILNLNIHPKFISFIVRNGNEQNILELVEELKKIESKFIWKVHAFTQDINFDEALKSVLDTNIKVCNSNYIWIRSYDQMINDKDEIGMINYLVNVKQDNVSILCSQNSETIHSCFLNTIDYEDLVVNVSTCLFRAIQIVVGDNKIEVGYYD